jgi:hypothetical protein
LQKMGVALNTHQGVSLRYKIKMYMSQNPEKMTSPTSLCKKSAPGGHPNNNLVPQSATRGTIAKAQGGTIAALNCNN